VVQSSWLLVPESNAALARAVREGRLGPSGAWRAWDVLGGLVAEVEALDLDEAVAARAGELAASLGLRGADAVHLASYEVLEGEESMLVSADGTLAHAARTLGHAVAVPA
jgi:uncharacterized protein